MAQKFGSDAFIESAMAVTEARVRSMWSFCEVGDSAIENLFSAALYFRVHLLPEAISGAFIIKNPENADTVPDNYLRIWPQRKLLDWPIDFVIEVKNAKGVLETLAVECDGHDFHERTKEQAARDRDRDRRLQQAGFTIFRFTGSELWRDPWGQIEQVIEWAKDARFKGALE